ncbi:MAG TPA: hypothetical protein VMK65_12475 [Longimicrobiales bacterium]|nr:hypothetical protein [Longimicrobiales bacterium]
MHLKRAFAVVVFAGMLPQAALAQDPEPPKAWRSLAFPAVGAVAFAGLASLAESGHEGAFCAQKSCLMTIGGVSGAIIGFLLGSDLDEKARARWTPAPQLSVAREGGSVPRNTLRLSPHPGGLAALSADGVVLLTPTLSTRVLLADRSVRAVAPLPSEDVILAAADSAVLSVPLEGGAVDTVLLARVTALAATPGGDVILGGRDRLERARLSGGSGGRQLVVSASGPLTGVPLALSAASGGPIWVAVDTLLEARDPAGLEVLGALALGGYPQDLVVAGRTALLAMGAAGVIVVDVSDPARPREVARLTDARTAHAVAVAGQELYVAGGGQGLFVYRLGGQGATLAGVVGDLGLVTDVAADASYVWTLDRTGSRVTRLEGAGSLAAGAAR